MNNEENKKEILKATGNRIKKAREAIGISQTELADKLGYKARSSVNKIERGERDVPRKQIAKIAEILNVTPAYLMGWEEVVEKVTEPVNPVWDELRNELMQLDIEELKELRNYIRYLISKRKEQD